MHTLVTKLTIGPEFRTRYFLFIDHGEDFGCARVTPEQLATYAGDAACLFKLPPGATAEVEIFRDPEPRHIFSVDVTNSHFRVSPHAVSEVRAGDAEPIGMEGECFKMCEGNLISGPCGDILNQTPTCHCSGGTCVIRCGIGQGGG